MNFIKLGEYTIGIWNVKNAYLIFEINHKIEIRFINLNLYSWNLKVFKNQNYNLISRFYQLIKKY